jgi:hypothetical protein
METDYKVRGGGNYFRHESLIANKCGEEASYTGWSAQRTRVGKGFGAPSGTHTNISIAEADESDLFFRSSALPKCP